jgi:hypothetical protein
MVKYRSTHQSVDFDAPEPGINPFADFKHRALELDYDIGLMHLRIETDQNIVMSKTY